MSAAAGRCQVERGVPRKDCCPGWDGLGGQTALDFFFFPYRQIRKDLNVQFWEPLSLVPGLSNTGAVG